MRAMRTVVAAALVGSVLIGAVPAAWAQDGAALFQSHCAECHNGKLHPVGLVYNAAGNAALLTTVNNLGMGASGSAADFASIVAYLDAVKPTITLAAVAHDSPGTVIALGDIIVSQAQIHAFLKVVFDIVTVSAPTKGTVSYTYGNGPNLPSTANYKPFPGQSGVDTWTYQGTGAQGTTTVRSASVNIAPAIATPDLNQHGLTGSWYQAATSGQGVEVEVFANPVSGEGSTFVSWFTYDTVSGGADRQRWYTAQGLVATGQPNAALTIYQNVGGNFNALPATTAQAVGSAVLTFDTCTSGQLAYDFSDGSGRTGIIPLVRLTQNVSCSTAVPYPTDADFALSGNWFNSATSGQGLTIEVNPISGTLFAAWYTYAPAAAADGAAGQRWYTAQAPFAPGSRSIAVTIYETSGGQFNSATPPAQTVAVGSGTLAFQSCSAATFRYAFTSGSSSGLSGTIDLSRVGPVPPGCPS
jgi:hypothetical protein